MPLSPGATFERYTIERLVGRGGMGEVYRATDTRLGRSVALKVLRSDDEGAAAIAAAGGAARLLREARAAAAFNHPHSVAIYELGEAEGIPYIAMELVRGSSLRKYVADGKTTLATKVGWLVDAARALHAAHRAGLVHRDIKPGNIMVSEDGVVKVLDFGLAKATTAKLDPHAFQTQLGQVLGTPRYMAPEQLDGEPANAKADQFAFGLVAYELLSGIYPGGPLAAMPRGLDEVVPGATRELAAIVTRMMARRAPERFPTMEDVANALRAAAPGVAGVAPMPAPAQAPAEVVPARDPRENKRPSDAPTRAVAADALPSAAHRTEPIPAQASSRHGWNRTMPMQASPSIPAPSLPFPQASGSQPSLPARQPSGVYTPSGAFAPPSPRQPYPSQPSQPSRGSQGSQGSHASQPLAPRFPRAIVLVAFGVAAVIGIVLVLVLVRR